jgi:cytosine/adenosine deaminase-related metal-dependent hydrolase
MSSYFWTEEEVNGRLRQLISAAFNRVWDFSKEKKADMIAVNIPETVSFNSQFPYESLLHSLSARDIVHVWVDGRKIF